MALCEGCKALGVCRLLSKDYRDGTEANNYKDRISQNEFNSQFEACGEKPAVREAITNQSVPSDFDDIAHRSSTSRHTPHSNSVHDGGHK